MNIIRRDLAGPSTVLGLVVVGILGTRAANALTADEEAVAKRLEAFRSAQMAADAKALDELCAAELSYSHSDAHIEDKATFIKNATAGKSKFVLLEYKDPRSAWSAMPRLCGFIGWQRAKRSPMARKAPQTFTS